LNDATAWLVKKINDHIVPIKLFCNYLDACVLAQDAALEDVWLVLQILALLVNLNAAKKTATATSAMQSLLSSIVSRVALDDEPDEIFEKSNADALCHAVVQELARNLQSQLQRNTKPTHQAANC
jgi:hypothetical protein